MTDETKWNMYKKFVSCYFIPRNVTSIIIIEMIEYDFILKIGSSILVVISLSFKTYSALAISFFFFLHISMFHYKGKTCPVAYQTLTFMLAISFYYNTILQIKIWIKMYNVHEIFSIPWYQLNWIWEMNFNILQRRKLYAGRTQRWLNLKDIKLKLL